jgi:Protein of unknown function (DUF3489)
MTRAKSKSKSKAKGVTRTTPRPPTKRQSRSPSAGHSPVRTAGESKLRVRPVPATSSSRSDTKHARLIAMLRSPAGATIVAMMTATDWQPHSVRGFLAGIVRKKLSLDLVSEPTDSGRVYRIKEGNASSVAAERVKRAA